MVRHLGNIGCHHSGCKPAEVLESAGPAPRNKTYLVNLHAQSKNGGDEEGLPVERGTFRTNDLLLECCLFGFSQQVVKELSRGSVLERSLGEADRKRMRKEGQKPCCRNSVVRVVGYAGNDAS